MTEDNARVTRRDILAALPVLAAPNLFPKATAATTVDGQGKHSAQFPEGFLWGSSTSGHQVEGNNVSSDSWLAEHVRPTIYKEPSGDACDQYHRFRDDIRLMSQLGLNCYRFSLEWARIEPEQGEFSAAELDHYRRVLAACQEFGVKPFVMFNHVTTPRWFAAKGGWENKESPDLFVRYCERANEKLGDLIAIGGTFNEPCVGGMLKWLGIPQSFDDQLHAMCRAAAKAVGSERFSMIFSYDQPKLIPQLLEAHRKGAIALKSGSHRYPVGLTLNVADDQAVGPESLVARKRTELYAPFLDAAKTQDDFIGIQNYGRLRYDNKGRVPPDKDNPSGDAFWPDGLEVAVRYAAKATGKPVFISENGFNTEDDTRRVEFIRRAVAGVKRAIDDGVDVRSYVHWSFLDNFEWFDGYAGSMGLVAVDRATQKRTIKPSALYLGSIARRNGL